MDPPLYCGIKLSSSHPWASLGLVWRTVRKCLVRSQTARGPAHGVRYRHQEGRIVLKRRERVDHGYVFPSSRFPLAFLASAWPQPAGPHMGRTGAILGWMTVKNFEDYHR